MKKEKEYKYVHQCYESHPPLKIGEYTVYGGSASWPIVTDADIYVSLAQGNSSGYATPPWEGVGVLDVCYPIVDGFAPKDSIRFKKMIDWLCNKLQEGKKLHIGCFGGHGRTGTVLSALVATILKEEDAITYVRKNYCKKVVESSEQVKFLHENFGVKKVSGAKSGSGFTEGNYDPEWWKEIPSPSKNKVLPISSKASSSHFNGTTLPLFDPKKLKIPSGVNVINPVKKLINLWPMK